MLPNAKNHSGLLPSRMQFLASLANPETDVGLSSLHEIHDLRKLNALFQPIVDLKNGEFLGFEGLIRGPANSHLHSPVNLFCAAEQQGLSLELEILSRQVVLDAYAKLKLPGKLFLNVSPDTLSHPSFKNGQTLEFMRTLKLDPARVVIEITENHPTFDLDRMLGALTHYRAMGFQIAIDDLGFGFSSLRLWSELNPDFIKIDMHFVQGVDSDPIKFQFLKYIQNIAQSCGTRVIAEGVETEAELRIVKDLGIALGQGYFIAKPSPTPRLTANSETNRVINTSNTTLLAQSNTLEHMQITALKLLTYVEPCHPETTNEAIFERFLSNPLLRTLPVVKNGVPVGIINRNQFVAYFSRHAESGRGGQKLGKEQLQLEPLLVEKNMPIEELSQFLAETDSRHFVDGFIITEHGRYIGVASGQDLLRELTQMQIEASRHANPLTLLPGLVPVNRRIELLLQNRTPFVACCGDLDHFRPFNEAYDYRKGDEMIQLTGRILNWACDPKLDFIGHIGGDDFILLMQSRDWRARCKGALDTYAQASSLLFDKAHLAAGGYNRTERNGSFTFQPLTSLSIGAIKVLPGQFMTFHEVSAAMNGAKRMAKQISGNSLFVETPSSISKP